MVVERKALLVLASMVVPCAGAAQIPTIRLPLSDAQRRLAEMRQNQQIQGLGNPTAPAKPKGLGGFLRTQILDRLDVAGQRTLSYHSHRVDGDREAFETLNYFGQGDQRWTNTGQMTVAGRKVLGLLDFNLQIADTRFDDPDASRVTLNYARGPVALSLGDIQGSLLNTNRHMRFSRTLNGAIAGFQQGRFAVRALRSESRGTATTVSIQGNNSIGPYYLQSGRVRANTVEVLVDGVRQRLGEDFELDSELGAITFISRLVPPTSTIVATYEAVGFNESAGTIQGAGATYDFGRFGRVGLTAMSQTGSGGGGERTRVDLFQGRGNPSVGYDLDFDPVPGTVEIRVGSILQVPNVDYTFDALYPRRFYMTRFIDLSQTVTAKYQPRTLQTVDGDRDAFGVDYRLPLGPAGENGSIGYSWARGRLADGGVAGSAQSLDAEYRLGELRFTGSVRDIPPDYVTVESRGFNRNERATELGVSYAAGRYAYQATAYNGNIFYRNRDGTGFDVARNTLLRGSVSYSSPGGERWSLEHTRSANRTTNEDRLDRTALRTGRTFGRLGVEFGLENQIGRGLISNGTTSEVGDLSIQSLTTGLSYRASDAWNLTSRISANWIKSLDERGTGRDVSIGATFRPDDRFQLTFGYLDSDSGNIASLGTFSNGSGIGYNGNGFSGGLVGEGFVVGAGNLRQASATASYRVNDRLSFTGRALQYRTEGDLSSNSDTFAYGLGAELDLGRSHLLSLSLDRSDTRFLGSVGGRADATSATVVLSASPPGRLSYSLAGSTLVSGGTANTGQDSFLYDLVSSYRLSGRERLTAGISNSVTSGYYAQDSRYFSLGYEYRLWQNFGIRGIYRFRDVFSPDPSISSGNYRSSGFDIEFVFDFGR